jgi:adenylate cyclase class 2
MSFEIEVKYRSVDHARLVPLLNQLGAELKSDDEQEDSYLNHPARDFAQSHEAFRIRRIGVQNRITYKGPRRPGPTKTREEIEIGFTEGPNVFQELSNLFGHLGFRHVATVTKRRRSFHLIHEGIEIEVGLDHVEGLGDFAEVEAIAPGDAEIPAAQRAILGLARVLGLDEVEPRSYLRMVLERESPEST